MFKNLKYRILFLFIGITSSIVLAFSFFLYIYLENVINEEVTKQLFSQASFIQEELVENEDIDYFNNRNILLDVEFLIQKEDKTIKKTEGFNFTDFNAIDKNREKSFMLIEKDNHVEDALFVIKFDKPFKGMVYLQKKNIHKKANEIKNVLWILNPILLLFLLVTAYKLVDKIFKNIKDVTKTAKDVSITNFSNTIPLPNDDNEIKELVDSFNNMIERLKDGIERLDRFNSDVSHELKTPLTVILGEVEVTLKKQREADYYINSLKTISYEAKQLETIVKDLLVLTKYSKENVGKTFKNYNLDALLLDAISKYDTSLNEKNMELDIIQIEPLMLNCNSQLISSTFVNLIDNAIKYSNPNTKISVELYEKTSIHFIIKDQGIGIAKNELNKIMDRFYRIEESRNKKIKGFGLGLSIVQNSVDLHSGKIFISSDIDKGTTIHIILPKN